MDKTNNEQSITRAYYCAVDTFNETQDGVIGRVLTIIDASISDPKQCKAIKDLMRQAIYSTPFVEIYRRLLSDIFAEECPEIKEENRPIWFDKNHSEPHEPLV